MQTSRPLALIETAVVLVTIGLLVSVFFVRGPTVGTAMATTTLPILLTGFLAIRTRRSGAEFPDHRKAVECFFKCYAFLLAGLALVLALGDNNNYSDPFIFLGMITSVASWGVAAESVAWWAVRSVKVFKPRDHRGSARA